VGHEQQMGPLQVMIPPNIQKATQTQGDWCFQMKEFYFVHCCPTAPAADPCIICPFGALWVIVLSHVHLLQGNYSL
jgi:hypothetical protein